MRLTYFLIFYRLGAIWTFVVHDKSAEFGRRFILPLFGLAITLFTNTVIIYSRFFIQLQMQYSLLLVELHFISSTFFQSIRLIVQNIYGNHFPIEQFAKFD